VKSPPAAALATGDGARPSKAEFRFLTAGQRERWVGITPVKLRKPANITFKTQRRSAMAEKREGGGDGAAC
jgi:hypothetical protein